MTFTVTHARHAFIKSECYRDDNGVFHWSSNKAVCPPDACVENGIDKLPAFCAARQSAAYDAEIRAFITEYRKNPPPVTDEMLSELRANHPPGTKIVDVISGRTIQL